MARIQIPGVGVGWGGGGGANCVYPNEAAQDEPPHRDLHRLLFLLLMFIG